MITYDQIMKANEGLASIDVKGKDYVMVPQRVKAFRKLYPEGFIHTKLISLADGVCVMQSEAGYYENVTPIVLGTGMAFERQESSFINKTSYIENCETSAVGRALGFLGLGIDGGGICSAEELVNAVNNQENNTIRSIPAQEPDNANADDLSEIRSRIEVAIKARTRDMSRAEKVVFLNSVVTPALQGERNWKTVKNPALLMNLLKTMEAA